MSDRKYRQRGYQDEPRQPVQRREKPAPEPKAPGRPLQSASGPKTPNLMGAHEVFRCARCGNRLATPVESDSRCNRCGTDVHSCVNCVSFDTSARWECTQQALAARVAPKDERNLCAFFAPRTTVERQTSTTGPTSARQAFDDLFK
jgi:hypothetical protein